MLDTGAELEAFSTVVEKIYDAAADSTQWLLALKQIANLTGASAAGLHFGDSAAVNQDPKGIFTFGFSDSFNSKIWEYAGVWALQSGLPFWDVGDVHHLPDILSEEELQNGRFYKEVLQYENQLDYMGMVALKEGTRYAPLTLATFTEDGPFSKRGVALARLVAPHICRAAKIGLALEMKSLDAKLMEATLNGLSAGVFVVNPVGRIVFMNHMAEQQIKRRRGLKIVNSHLVPVEATAANAFAHCFASSKDMADEYKPAMPSIALPDELGGLIATLLPLGSGQRQLLAMDPATAGFAIFVQDPMQAPPNPGEGFAKLYGLTPAELRTLMAMTMSQGPQDAADILGVSITTIRSHLQHIFAKTETSKQAELMQLLMRASAPLISQPHQNE
jgi:DNA-binding CsgD family transcriptional regulator/PAS domain-containing protein